MEKYNENFAERYIQELKEVLGTVGNDLKGKISRLENILVNARDNRKTIFVMGNGGSASTASHFAGDLSKLTICENSPRFKVMALTDSIPTMLAWANDKSYEDIFLEQLKSHMECEDIVIGISASGNSRNVIKAVEYANENRGITIGLSGYDGGKLIKCAQENLHVPSYNMQQVEDAHLIILHLLASLIQNKGKEAGK